MKKLLFLFLLSPLFTMAQDKAPQAEGVSPNLYVNHKVAAKENYYSIGRIYNISPKDIAPFNKLQLETGLSLGQIIKVPLNSSNFFQSGSAATDETFVPVYYTIKDKEGLYRVAKNHNDVPLETLKQWNKITGDAVKNGTKLIVGYLKVKTELSPLAKNGIGTAIDAKVVAAAAKPEENKIAETKTVKTEVEKKEPAKAKPAAKEVETVVVNPEKKEPVKTAKEPAVVESKKTTSVKSPDGESFKSVYDSQVKNAEKVEASGMAGIFKSTSGWTDKKYYCLHNNATPGTIIKITNSVNNKFIFAKVLDAMPDIKQNEGLLLLISNAAAGELGVAEGNVNCEISYSK
ncbi:MAG: LysM peptidoglycan-binding domain-containing protein [Ferruginibacter sp.]